MGTNYDKNIIVYRREYSIFDNEIVCNYQASEDYVMKSYFNSVYSKHRPFNLLSMGESTTRAENKKTMLLLSKNVCYYHYINNLSFNNFNNIYETFFNCINKDKDFNDINEFDYSNKINVAILNCNGPNYDSNGNIVSYSAKNYLSDINSFINGYS